MTSPSTGTGGPQLTASYTFENGYVDSSGHGLNGTPHGSVAIVYDQDRHSNVLDLSGQGACVDLGNDSLFNQPDSVSIALWIKLRAWHGNWDTVLKKNGSWSIERHIDLQMLAFYHWPNFVPTTTPLVADGRWHHVAVTYDGLSQDFYLDGVQVAHVGNPGRIAVTTSNVWIGAAEGVERFFDGWLDDVGIYRSVLTQEEIRNMAGAPTPGSGVWDTVVATDGNFELNAEVAASSTPGPVQVFFSCRPDSAVYAFLEIQGDDIRIGRVFAGQKTIWKTARGAGGSPWSVRVLKKGNFYRFWVNGATAWIRGPLGEWDGIYEPWSALAGVIAPDSGLVRSFSVTPLPWLQQVTEALIPRGPVGSYYEAQVIPGAILQYAGTYYLYFMAGKTGTQEGATERTIGVASSTDLLTWAVEPEPILSYAELGGEGDNLYPGGAVITPDGKIGLMYAVQKFPDWKGFYLATADHPLGPFQNYSGNPVYRFSNTAHEFDLVRVDQADRRYILFFSGFTLNPPSGPVGDRGYLIYSDDLIQWREDSRNPVFGPETLNDWDAVHIRPRSLNLIGDTYYLWYEGANTWRTPTPGYVEWWDAIGLARSADLVQWEYYPRNPALPGLGLASTQWDKNWVGWPRMVVRNDTGYVFYTGDGETGMRSIPLDWLVNWEYEGDIQTGVDSDRPTRPDGGEGTPSGFRLFQNYPNPFNPTTTVAFTVPHQSRVTITVCSILGEVVRTVVDRDFSPGTHAVTFEAEGLAGGVYFCRLHAGGFTETRKLLILR